ncbi:integrase [Rhodococcus sp. WS4]|nr:integrase [Rhodococcus sp. WS4]
MSTKSGTVQGTALDAEPHPFRGLAVAEAAGLRLEPGSPRAVFDQPVWDLTGLADAPVVMGAHRKILDFTEIANPRWALVAREYLLARLAPLHEAVATLPHAYRAPMNPHSLWAELRHLTSWFNSLTDLGVTTLGGVDQRHCDTYLAQVSRRRITPDRDPAGAAVVPKIRAVKNLALYAEVLSDCYRPGFEPWPGRSANAIAGCTPESGNKVPPVPDSLLRPLLSACLYLVHTLAPHVIREAVRVRAADTLEMHSRRGLRIDEIEPLRRAIEHRRAAGIPAYRIGPTGRGQRQRAHWDPTDLIDLGWHPLVVETAHAMGHRRDLERLRPELEAWVAECGIEEPWCRDASVVPHHRTDDPVAWARPLARYEFDATCYAVLSACYYLTSALTGMRASELSELRAGCRHSEPRPGGGTRFRLTTRRIKGERFGGAEDSWVVIDDVHHAIGVAEELTAAPAATLLFAADSNTSFHRYVSLRTWINGEHGQRLGLEPIPDGSINPRTLRRTLAMTLAQRPHGLLAAKVALKHVSVVTTEGYAARPGGHQAAFLFEVAAEEKAEHLRLTVAAYRDYQQGILPAGKGTRELLSEFAAVDAALAGHDPGPVTVVDDRRVERALKTRAATLHIGAANYCWFSNPAKALCLQLAGDLDREQPLIGMCDSARCPQATHHHRHRQVWADHADNIRTTFLGNPRLSRPERARAQATYDRAVRVITEIDTAARTAAEDPAP